MEFTFEKQHPIGEHRHSLILQALIQVHSLKRMLADAPVLAEFISAEDIDSKLLEVVNGFTMAIVQNTSIVPNVLKETVSENLGSEPINRCELQEVLRHPLSSTTLAEGIPSPVNKALSP
ncbi:hypothetical protein [Pseudomonas coronafaciens]|uniref:hypothetical protein n=1 Tax=Pseudomonas coronafaciens TaxID=53409 RepID=UPI000F3F757C|nr:hypothetical protein [Pseudomonas coronafaciens]RMP24048.1 hypothetical protein ALQ25_200047 [Pseudomonas coronafaciens pv. atropurpurea]